MNIKTSFAILSIFCIISGGCGGSGGSSSGKMDGNWVYQGATYQVKMALAKNEDFFGTKGLAVFFYHEDVTCEDSNSDKDYVEIFFPIKDSAYTAPTSINFKAAAGGNTSESSTSGYSGEITSSDESTVQGWVKIEGVGMNSDASIESTFSAQICAD